jgi:uncharacterized protein (DUF885 family)
MVVKGLVLALVLAGAPMAAMAAPADEAALARIIADYEAFERAEDPFTAGTEGDRAALSRWGENTPAAEARRKAALERFRTRLAAVPAARLSTDSQLNRDLLSRTVETRLEGMSFDPDRIAIDFEGGPGQFVAYAGDTTTIRDRADADAWIARLEGIPKLYADSTANARRGLSTGWIQPRPVVDSALGVLRSEVALTADNDPLLKPFRNLPASISAADQARLRERARTIVRERIIPARRDFLRFVEQEYSAKAPAQGGASSLPNGRAYYQSRVRYHTTTSLTPDQIHDLGQSEVRRIRAEMDAVMREAGWTRSFPEFLTYLRTDPKFYAQSREDLLEKASEISKRADYALPKLFKTLPRLPYGVIPTPREVEAQSTTGRYYQGSPTLGQAGAYLINTGNLPARPLYELPALTVHEAVPGHHLQIALAQELGELPYFRRNANVTAFTEGWGLYAEFLGWRWASTARPMSASASSPTRCGAPAGSWPTPAFTGRAGPRSRPAPASPTTPRCRPATSRPS